MRKKLRKIVEERDTKAGRIFDLVIQLLILISIVSFSLETLPNFKNEFYSILEIIEIICIVIFSIEYILRVIVNKQPLKYIFSFFGLIDLLAIIPFYISVSIDLRGLRAFRFLRIFRTLKIARYNSAFLRFKNAFKIVREEIILFFITAIILIYLSAVGIYFFEKEAQPDVFVSIFHALWWSVITLTTVGYGDVYPITAGGKIFTFFILIFGIGIVTVPAGIIASALSKARDLEGKKD